MKRKNKHLIIIAATFVLIFLSGCGLWQNFTVYFNTYYNAVDIFELAEEDIKKENTETFEFKEKKIPASANQSLTKVIEKCSKILQFDKESSYFDDALFMIGKSFYYQGEYSKAARKFNELASVQDTDLSLINQFWVGRTELQLRNFDAGNEILQNVAKQALEEGEPEIAFDAYIKRIAFFINREDYPSAIELGNELLGISDNNELNAEVSFRLGKLYIELNQVENAAAAFARVDEFSPTFDIEFASNFENAKLQKQLGNIDESFSLLQNLKNQDKYEKHFDKIDLEIAQIHLDKNEHEKALAIYTIVDTTYKNSASAGMAKFKKAEIWEKHYRDYDSAKFYYDQLQQTQAEAELKRNAKRKGEIFTQYRKINTTLAKYFKQYLYMSDPDAFYRDSLEYEDLMSRDSLNTTDTKGSDLENLPDEEPPGGEKRPGNPRGGNRNFGEDDTLIGDKNKMDDKPKYEKPVRMNISDDSLNAVIAKNLFNLGNIFLGDLEVPDSAYFYYSRIDADYPDNNFKPKFLFALGSYYSTIGEDEKADSLYNLVYTNYSIDETANEAARRLGKTEVGKALDQAELAYLSAENIFYSSKFTEAVDSFYNIYLTYPNSYLAPKALFTAGWIFEHELSMFDSAAKAYDTLSVKYANTDYTRSIRNKLYAYNAEIKRVQDSIALVQKQIEDSIAIANAPLIEETLPDSTNASALTDSLKLQLGVPDSTAILPADSVDIKRIDSRKEFDDTRDIKPKIPPDTTEVNIDSSKVRRR